MFSKKFGVGLFFQVIIKLLAISLGFISTRWIVQNFSSQEYLQYNLIIAYTGILLPVINFGIPSLIQKYYTNTTDKQTLADVWTTMSVFRTISYFVGIVILLLTFNLVNELDLLFTLGIYTIQFILVADLSYRSICDANGHAWQFSISDFLGKSILIILLLSFSIFAPQGVPMLVYFIGASGIAYSTALIIDSIWQRKYTKGGRLQWKYISENRSAITFLTLTVISAAIIANIDRLFLSRFGYSAEVINGYANAYKFFEIGAFLPGLTMPTVASSIKKRLDASKGEKQYTKLPLFGQVHTLKASLFKYLALALILGIITGIGFTLILPFAISLIDPQLKYPSAYSSGLILGFGLIPFYMIYMISHLTIFSDGEKYDLISSFTGMVIGICAYLILIPKFGVYGAAWGTVITYYIDFLIKIVFLLKRIRILTE